MILPIAAQPIILTPRSWMDVLKVASFNYFTWLAVFVVLAGLWLLFRRQGWTRVAAALAILAGMTLLLMVLKDIKREVPGIRTQRAPSQQSGTTGRMAATLRSSLKRWRENYVPSLLLSGIAKPLWLICSHTANMLQTKVAKNGVTFQLPNGRKMTIGRDAGIALASLLFWHGLDGYEPATSKALRFFFARSSTFIDVGANCGLYSVLEALWNPDIKVTSFEPFQPIFERLKKNVRLNFLEGRIVCENIALSSRSGNANLYVPPSEGADFETTGTLAANSWQVRKGSAAVQVEAMRFDDYERHHPMKVDLIKIDVEDFEADVLEGMSATIRRDRPFIICEILERNREHRNERTRRLIENWNYTPYWIAPSGYIRVTRFDFSRKDSQDFILSPVSTRDEIIDNLNVLFEARLGLEKHDLSGTGEQEMRTNGPTGAYG